MIQLELIHLQKHLICITSHNEVSRIGININNRIPFNVTFT